MTLTIIFTVVGACLFAEFAGYFIHMLLHSDKVEFLSRNHMLHHLKIYGPKMHMRPADHYIVSTEGRASIGKIGLEWILPIGMVAGLCLLSFWLLHIGVIYRVIFMTVSTGWGLFMFNFLHDRLHVKGYWMERHPLFRGRFLKARKLHDLHHMDLSDDGRMTQNFGICFFAFDWLFGSLRTLKMPFNKRGFEAAQMRYSYIYDDAGQVRNSDPNGY